MDSFDKSPDLKTIYLSIYLPLFFLPLVSPENPLSAYLFRASSALKTDEP